MKFDYIKMGRIALIIINYSVRIALAAVIVLWCIDQVKVWDDFQVFKQWNDQYQFEGSGSYESPYLINDAADIIKFSDAVNNGNDFAGLYFRQTADIDLSECSNFTPIGTVSSGNVFRGIYDGGNHRICNITINGNLLDETYVGLFGRLSGVVMNLGIESGHISGKYVGSVAYTDGSTDAMIINCYNRANLNAIDRCGGIAENFSSGRILGCANYGHLAGNVTCQIVSYNCSVLSGCCNLSRSHDNMYPIDTFTGMIFDCYVGTDDVTELNSRIDDYQDFIIYPGDPPIDVTPWAPEEP